MISSEKLPHKPDEWFYSLKSPNKVAWILGFPRPELEKLTENSKKFYAPFNKKRGKSKPRRIANPQGILKIILRKINKRILNKYPFPNYIIGGVKDRNPLEHPFLHIRKSVVVTIDVKDCFPSISNTKIFRVWKDRLKCSPDVAHMMTKLTTFEGKLPLGNPTSGALANLALLNCVEKTKKIAEKYTMELSQYIDDQAASGQYLPDGFISEIIKEFSREGFTINRKKIQVMRSGQRQQVAKKNVSNRVTVPRVKRNEVFTELKMLEATDPELEQYRKLFNRVGGRIASLNAFHPGLALRLSERLDKLPKPLASVSQKDI